ncbi:MAG: hypothetical protein UHJ46_07190 [Treponema sp.]|nr:hypothetical protein [Treponema sp.]
MVVKEAAIATVIGQALTFAMSVTYLFRAKNFIINKKSVHLEASILSRIISIGMASLIVQLSIMVISHRQLFWQLPVTTSSPCSEPL